MDARMDVCTRLGPSDHVLHPPDGVGGDGGRDIGARFVVLLREESDRDSSTASRGFHSMPEKRGGEVRCVVVNTSEV